ncbi:hypothetical protein B0H16DRAFT_1464782 [Mycena metata]|uniref:F-box domain-containing protein n=1 Tax=Mycena metata TaxID=1033252 RepID=A0AAD7IDV1_9AGAR|nr:hypothetical protein B0H16DRAFT_1464782 [Mycena metata]
MARTSISHFPAEIGVRIFNEVFYCESSFSFSKFVRTRWTMRRASSEWMRIISGFPKFWTPIYMDLDTPAELIQTFVERAGGLNIKLCMDFHSVDNYFEAHRDVHTSQELVTERMSIVQLFIDRVDQIMVETEDRTVYDSVQDALRASYAPLLREVTIRFTHSPTRQDYGALNRPGWSAVQLPNVERIHLHGTLFPFPLASAQSHTLRELRIYNVPMERAFDCQVIGSVVMDSPRLEELALWGVHFSGETTEQVKSMSLHTLRLNFGDPNVTRLAVKLDLPNLRTVHLLISHPTHVDRAVTCPQLWSGATHLKIDDNGRDVYNLPPLFEMFRSVTHLDITDCEGQLLHELIAYSGLHMSGETTTVFCQLQSLETAHATALEVLQFCMRHGANGSSDGSQMKLREVMMGIVGRPFGRVEHARNIEWMRKHVRNFRVYKYSSKWGLSVEEKAAKLTV